MKRFFSVLAVAIMITGLCGCDEDEETSDGTAVGRLNGTWNGTMVATQLMGLPAEDSDVVPIMMVITETSSSSSSTLFTLVLQANGMPGTFSGIMDHSNLDIEFVATADYTYAFVGRVDSSFNSMSGTWSVNIPGGMSGTWQASR